jgi:hypothetical protein
MAKFLKVVSSDATDPEVLIGIDQITHVAAGDAAGANTTTHVTVFYTGGTCTVAFTAGEAAVGDVLKAFNAALSANPGGIVSTVNRPLLTAQVVAPASAGRQLITSEAVYVTYTGVVFA